MWWYYRQKRKHTGLFFTFFQIKYLYIYLIFHTFFMPQKHYSLSVENSILRTSWENTLSGQRSIGKGTNQYVLKWSKAMYKIVQSTAVGYMILRCVLCHLSTINRGVKDHVHWPSACLSRKTIVKKWNVAYFQMAKSLKNTLETVPGYVVRVSPHNMKHFARLGLLKQTFSMY